MIHLDSNSFYFIDDNIRKNEEAIINSMINDLPTEEVVSKNFLTISTASIENHIKNNLVNSEAINDSLKRSNRFEPLLSELDKLKNELGGSPNFSSKPEINPEDSKKTFFGIPMSALKDWFRMTLVKEWKPQIFWESIAKIFNITRDNQFSQYEEAYVSIQRFELLIANKERFFNILEFNQEERYGELSTVTGLAWHPHSNGCGIEKLYIEFVEKFLTEYFEDAKQKGDEALLEYFKAFSGVCFEDRARTLETYAITHPLTYDVNNNSPIDIPPDWDTLQPVENAFMKETQALFEKLGEAPNTNQLLEHLKGKGIFDLAFSTTLPGEKVIPSEEQFYLWAQEQVETCILSE